MATINKNKSFLQKFSDKAMNTIRSDRGVSVNLPNKKYTILDRNSNPPTPAVKNGYVDQIKLNELIKQQNTLKGVSLNPMAASINASAKYSNATTGVPFPSVVRPTTTVAPKVTTTVTPTVAPTVAPTSGGKPVDVENEIEYLKGILNNPDSTAEAKAFAVKEGKRLYGTDITEKTIDQLNQDAINAQEAFITKGVESNVQGLTDAQQRALATIEGQRAGIAPQFQNLRSQASTTSMQQARNFAEYMGARGASMGGTSAQAEIQRGTQLQGQFGQIGLAEQGAIQGLEDKKTEVALDFETKISQAKTQGEADIERFKLQQILKNIDEIKTKRDQKEQNAYDLEQQKLKEAAETSKSQLEFNRKKELIEFETAQSIKKAYADAELKAKQATVDFGRKPTTIPKDVPFEKQKGYLNILNKLDEKFTTDSTVEGKANLLEEDFLDGGKLNRNAISAITGVRDSLGEGAAKAYRKRLEELLGIES